jgi:hypothetical protein
MQWFCVCEESSLADISMNKFHGPILAQSLKGNNKILVPKEVICVSPFFSLNPLGQISIPAIVKSSIAKKLFQAILKLQNFALRVLPGHTDHIYFEYFINSRSLDTLPLLYMKRCLLTGDNKKIGCWEDMNQPNDSIDFKFTFSTRLNVV